jgi:hypothetical protein
MSVGRSAAENAIAHPDQDRQTEDVHGSGKKAAREVAQVPPQEMRRKGDDRQSGHDREEIEDHSTEIVLKPRLIET